jgi:RNA polymerase sigma-70 factor (ECF subfamily)
MKQAGEGPGSPGRKRFVRGNGAGRTATSGHDEELVAQAVLRAQQGEMDALRFLYVRYADQVFAYIQSFVRDQHEAEDITQTVFTKLMKVIPRYKPREVPFSAWIMRVARNTALDALRSRRAVPCGEVVESREGASVPAGPDRALALKEAFAQLPGDQRKTLLLRHVAGLSPGEIADALDKTERAVHGLHHRGRGTMQNALRERDAGPVTATA